MVFGGSIMARHGREPVVKSLLDGLNDVVSPYRQRLARAANQLVSRLPPVVIERRIESLGRHMDKRLKDIERKVDQLVEQKARKAA
jgi:hypothetical protein